MAEGEQELNAFNSGYDAGRNGPNTVNCNFRLFATPEMTKAWECGNKVGVKDRPKRKSSHAR